MPWIKLDDQWMDHPKIVKAGRDARDVWLASLTWCARHLTDGHFPAELLPSLAITAGVDVANCQTFASALVEVCLWERTENGYHIHDYNDYNPTKEQSEATKKARSEAGRVGGVSKSAKSKQNPGKTLANDLAKSKQKSAPSPSPSPSIEKDSLGEKVQEMLDAWKVLFPNKPQPKPDTFKAKIKTRLENADFAAGWRKALETAAQSPSCQNESWFNFEYLVTNDKNFQKMIDRWMEWKDREQYGINGGSPKPNTPPPPRTRKVTDVRGNVIAEVPL